LLRASIDVLLLAPQSAIALLLMTLISVRY
jgi:hypothetical protein